ncbi:MAG: hypothetical protein FLDDKLPJ_01907 [Phycisphaerae bacterium]|nr:hypothetical protein [Phycisphaerae bacterium]
MTGSLFRSRRERGIVLPMVLLVLVLVAVMATSFAFHTGARLAGTRAVQTRLQTRLAAEAGLEKAKLLLANRRLDMNAWHHDPEELHRVIVYMPNGDETIWGTRDEYDDEKLIYRFSLVSDDFTDDEEFIRFGITDESSKLNLNTATREQLLIIVQHAIGDRAEELEFTADDIVDAILDWRDEDDAPQQEEGDTEGPYYDGLVKRYPVKNAPFETVEELLLVKGVDGRLLYGEDQDRNGLLSTNEDDGAETFPDDNADGFLSRGMYPYLTVYSLDRNISNDNRQRISLYQNQGRLRQLLMEEFAEDNEKVNYVLRAVARPDGGGPGGGPGRGGPGRPGGAPGRPGAGGPTRPPGGDAGSGAEGDVRGGFPRGGPPTEGEGPRRGGGRGGEGRGGEGRGGEGGPPRDDFDEDDFDDDDELSAGGKSSRVLLAKFSPQDRAGSGGGASQPPPDDDDDDEDDEGVGDRGGSGRLDEGDDEDDEEGGGDGSGDGGGQTRPVTTPAQLLGKDEDGGGSRSPFTVEDLPQLMDRLTAEEEMEVRGLININTAPDLVLRCVPGLAEEEVAAIVARRAELDSLTKSTTAWLVTEGVIGVEKYVEIAPKICARGTQFTVEALGYADHVGMVTRIQVIYDMRGPLAQTMYYRDLTQLGGSFPIREEDEESFRVP